MSGLIPEAGLWLTPRASLGALPSTADAEEWSFSKWAYFLAKNSANQAAFDDAMQGWKEIPLADAVVM
jgi:hypothetical protein